jgi:hypothetical protein
MAGSISPSDNTQDGAVPVKGFTTVIGDTTYIQVYSHVTKTVTLLVAAPTAVEYVGSDRQQKLVG